MKRLTIIRHAKSSWRDTSLDDFDRPLSSRGERDAPRMGERLRTRRARPSLFVSSPARRARKTARIIAECIGFPVEFLHLERALYHAGPDTLLDVVAGQDDNCSDLMLVAHNPGLTMLVNRVVPDLGLANLPTTGIVAVDFDADQWSDLATQRGTLVFYDYPKNTTLVLPSE